MPVKLEGTGTKALLFADCIDWHKAVQYDLCLLGRKLKLASIHNVLSVIPVDDVFLEFPGKMDDMEHYPSVRLFFFRPEAGSTNAL